MGHPRAGIRHYVRNLLKTPDNTEYPTTAGNKVFAMRTVPVQREDTPAVGIYTMNEQVDSDYAYYIGTDPVRRLLTLNIDIYAIDKFNQSTGQVSEQADDLVDTVAWEVEAKLINDPTLGGRIDQLKYSTFDVQLVGGEEGAPVVVATQSWEVGYWVRPPEPEEGTLPTAIFVRGCPPYGEEAEDRYWRFDPDENDITFLDDGELTNG